MAKGNKARGGRNSKKERRIKTKKALEAEIAAIKQRIEEEKPPRGTNPLAADLDEKKLKENYQVYYPEAKTFVELPLSKRTKKGLAKAGYQIMTDIQRATLPHALAGRDVLGAARTGSGKTLAFLIPVLENLFLQKWGPADGLGALIILPTRELALQVFEVLRVLGNQHDFSAGLVIGGKNFEEEQTRITRMNILVCTPGRLLQHLEQTAYFDCPNLRVLVLDEADRILDMGFEKVINSVLEHLPQERQTLLFSATQTKSLRTLARLSLKDPEYISVHEHSETSTPQNLRQSVLYCQLNEKLDTLFSFLKSHTKCKILVFLSSCKQVRFIYETFRKLQPGLPVSHLHGKMKQMKRMATYVRFCEQKYACMFATDIAGRGLDFPALDWVIQVDCPEDVAMYIHRVGRTARYKAGGHALLFLLPSEQKMETLLQENKIPIETLQVNPARTMSIKSKLQGFLSEDPELKYLAQKCFISYLRSVFLQKNKEVFDVNALPSEEYAASLGLVSIPRIRFTQNKKTDKNAPFALKNTQKEGEAKELIEKSKVEKLLTRKNTTVLSDAYSRLRANAEDEEDDLLVVKKRHAVEEIDKNEKGKGGDEFVREDKEMQQKKAQEYVEFVAQALKEEDAKDKVAYSQRLKNKSIEMKKRWKEQMEKELEREYGAMEEEEEEIVEEEQSGEEVESKITKAKKGAKEKKQKKKRKVEDYEDEEGDDLEAQARRLIQKARRSAEQ